MENGVPTYFMTLQIRLSKLLDKVQGIGAGMLVLSDVINQNKVNTIEDVRNFFQVLEVYGHGTEIYIYDQIMKNMKQRFE